MGYFGLYLASRRTAHRLVGYFEEEAVLSYTRYLNELEAGRMPNPPAPATARHYWKMADDATLADVVRAVLADEAVHRDVNHGLARTLKQVAAGERLAPGAADDDSDRVPAHPVPRTAPTRRSSERRISGIKATSRPANPFRPPQCVADGYRRLPETVPLPGDALVKKVVGPHAVSANNPCPFLRALVAMGRLSDDREPLAKVAAVVAAPAPAGAGRPVLPTPAGYAVA
ncbi:MAG: hypothetical protein CFE32_22455, partial [Alphaproteobacteria bacterium PA3]